MTEREKLLRIAKENFPDLEERFAPDSVGWYELHDRLHMIRHMWGEFIHDHPACCLYPEVFAICEEIEKKMTAMNLALSNLEKTD